MQRLKKKHSGSHLKLMRSIQWSLIFGLLPLFTWADDLAGCGACGAMGGFVVFLVVGLFVLNIVLLAWVMKDAKSRDMDSPMLWMILVLFTGVIGLFIYLLARPKGELVECGHCENKRMKSAAACPHCKNS